MLEKRKRIKPRDFNLFSFIKLSPPAYLAFLLGLGIGAFFSPFFQESWKASSTEQAHIRVCFSPEGQCTNNIISAIENAETSVLVQSYSFTSSPIAQALGNAVDRGVSVKLLIDKSQLQAKRSQLLFLAQKGIPIFIDPASGIAHNKTMIIDDKYVLTGSFNWTDHAESRNAENVLLINDPSLAKIYKENWEKRVASATNIKS